MVEIAEKMDASVINARCNLFHPCHALATMMTVLDNSTNPSIVYIGKGNAQCNSLIMAADRYEIPLTVSTPQNSKPFKEINSGTIDEITFNEITALRPIIETDSKTDKLSFLKTPSEAISHGKNQGDVFLYIGDLSGCENFLRSIPQIAPHNEVYNNTVLLEYTKHDHPSIFGERVDNQTYIQTALVIFLADKMPK
ncbi:MAG: hypothetical protein ABIA21_02855 [Candidatus Aenigmatarchaeota archaeon]